ncbi:hypothetical protein BGX26_010795 [Mortierella sp. AD094]|nr:hypothetical protein BGX26_010795 [Mortierella sp. AD094]
MHFRHHHQTSQHRNLVVLAIALHLALTCLSQPHSVTSAAPNNLHSTSYDTRSDFFEDESISPEKTVHETKKGIPGYIAAIDSPTEFCFPLPPDPAKETVAEAEYHAVSYCTSPNVKGAVGAKVFPDNFIVSAHYKKDESSQWVQTTGLLNPTVYGMSMSDDGGQYDVKAPVGASCAGYNSFVNLIEPSSNRYCIRCCMNREDCNVGISETGCHRIVPGDYGLGGSVQGKLLHPESARLTPGSQRLSTKALDKKKQATQVQQASSPQVYEASPPFVSDPSHAVAKALSSERRTIVVQSDASMLLTQGSDLVVKTAKVLGIIGLFFALAF